MGRLTRRLVALDPMTWSCAFVELRSPEFLADWGFVHCRERTEKRIRARVLEKVRTLGTTILVLERPDATRRGTRAKERIRFFAKEAQREGIAIYFVSRREVRTEFAASGVTKYAIAEALARVFPELAPRLPPPRRPWQPEDARMNLFDALSFGFTAFQTIERGARFLT